jgi:hypothetical protein
MEANKMYPNGPFLKICFMIVSPLIIFKGSLKNFFPNIFVSTQQPGYKIPMPGTRSLAANFVAGFGQKDGRKWSLCGGYSSSSRRRPAW